MGVLIAENWPNLLEPGLRSVFFMQRDALAAASPVPKLFNVQSSAKAVEHTYGIGGLGDVPEFNGTIAYDTFDGLYKKDYTHVEYALGMAVERKLVDDDQYNVINQRARMLATSFVRTREKKAASVFNNAFSSSYLGSDSKALCATDHPLGPSNASTQGNKGTSALSAAAISATRLLMREFKDDRGELITVMPDTLLVPPELEETATIIVKTAQKVGSADNDINYAASLIKNVIVWDYLTDANNWFLIDSTMAKLYLNWFDRVATDFKLDPTSDFNLVARYRGYERYSYGWDTWQWIFGHEVS